MVLCREWETKGAPKMNSKENSLGIEFSIKQITDLFLLISIISLLSLPLALARESQTSIPEKKRALPVVSAVPASEPEKAMAQPVGAYSSANSVDFLMEKPPLEKSATMDAVLPGPVHVAPQVGANPVPAVLPDLPVLPVERTDEVAMLVEEQCSQGGSAANGTNSCKRVYSNGHHATVLTQNANEGDELKNQTVIEEFDGNNTLLFRKTIRHRVDYNYLNDQKAKEKEFFDIVYQPAGKKTTRELMVYEFFLETGKAKSLSWTQYQQIASESKAELVYHSVLRYGNDGSPDRGLAERWDHGRKAETFMNWSRRSKGFATLDEEAWGQWEGWIRNVSLQAYLP